MQESVGSFFKFVLGFLFFISASFGVTYAVNAWGAQDMAQEAATAIMAVFGK